MRSVLEYPPHISIRDAKTKKLWIKDKLTVLEKRIESLGIFFSVGQASSQKEWYRSYAFVDDSITYELFLEFRRNTRILKNLWISKIQNEPNSGRVISFEEVLTSIKNPKIKSTLLFNLDLFV